MSRWSPARTVDAILEDATYLRPEVAHRRSDPGETPATRRIAHDGFGRAVVALTPAHAASPGWVATTTRRGADGVEVEDALGINTQVTSNTLARSTAVEGIPYSEQQYDALARSIREEDSLGRAQTRTYEQFGQLSTLARVGSVPCGEPGGVPVDCNWSIGITGYDASGMPVAWTDEHGTAHTAQYDAIGRLTSRAVDGVTVQTVTHLDNLANPQVVVEDESGTFTQIATDGLGRQIASSVLDIVTSTTWGANGRPTQTVDANGRATTYTYDIHDRLISSTLPGGGVVSTTYDGASRPTTVTDADGVTFAREYLYSGVPAEVVRAGSIVEWDGAMYDALGRPLDVTAAGVRRTYLYDLVGRVVQEEIAPDAAGVAELVVVQSWNGLEPELGSRAVTHRGGPTVTESLTYDAWGRLASTTDGASGTTELRWENDGQIRYRRDPDGHVFGTRYDARGRPIAEDFPGGTLRTVYLPQTTYGGLPNLTGIEQYTDPAGQEKTRIFWDGAGREVARVSPTGEAVEQTWVGAEVETTTFLDELGVPIALVDATYDPAGRVETVTGPYAPGDVNPDVVAYTYTPAGRLWTHATQDVVTTFGYAAGRPVTETWDDQQRTVTYDPGGAPWVVQEVLADLTSGQTRTRTWAHDALGRTTSETATAPGQPSLTPCAIV